VRRAARTHTAWMFSMLQWVIPYLRRWADEVEQATVTLSAELGREPTHDEFVEHWMRTAGPGGR
jgi:hypothetical protein